MTNRQPDQYFESDSGQIIGRFGSTVHRKTGSWTPAVHSLLNHLEGAGFAYSPRVLDSSDPSIEELTYIEGSSGKDIWKKVASDSGLRSFAKLLRSYHDAVESYRPNGQIWATTHSELQPDEIICHGDFGPWNTVWQGSKPVGIIDWDLAGPRPKMYDIAYALEYTAPFRDDEECMKWLGYTEPPDRARRIRLFAEAYGLSNADGLYEEVVRAQEAGIKEVESLANQGVQPQVEWVESGHLKELSDRVAWSRQNKNLFV